MSAKTLVCIVSTTLILSLAFDRTLARESDLIFKPVDADVAFRLTATLEDKFEAGVKPLGYRRHQFIEIDVGSLTRELQKSLHAAEKSQPKYLVSIPLFEDRSIDVSISIWPHGNFGGHMARGTVSATYPTDFSVSFYFTEESLRKVTIETPARRYLIESSAERPYYVLFEIEYVDAEM